MIRFSPSHLITVDAAAAGELPRRSISGVAVEWNQVAVVSSGEKVMFLPGSLPVDGRRPKLYMQHDPNQIIGQVVERIDSGDALMFTASISATALGNEALTLMSDGTLSEVSVGVNVEKFSFDKQGVMVIESASFNELSVVSQPAFASSVITDVAASIPQTESEISNNDQQVTEKESPMTTEITPIVEAQAAVEKLWAQPTRAFKMPSAAEYIAAAFTGGETFSRMVEGIRAAAPDVNTGTLDGLLPIPTVAPIYNNLQGYRPIVDAITPRAMPTSGKVFIRPKVTTNVSQGLVTQSTTITAGQFIVDDIPVTKNIYGGYVSLSEASIDWTSPEVLGALLDDMARVYANTTDNVAADALAAGVSQTATLTDADDPADWIAFVYEAAVTILENSNGNLPTHIFMTPAYFGALGRLVDSTGRPLFPAVGPMNAYGQVTPGSTDAMAFGLRVVVDRFLPAGNLIVGDASGFENWEQQKGAISIENPSQLSRTIAWRGYFASIMIDATKFVKRG
jgi:HK97 family phage prohead protease